MTIYLIRHTTPKNAKGLCYGFADIDVDENFIVEAEGIKCKLISTIKPIYCSPLKRCSKLANYLFKGGEIYYEKHLQEMNFGDWENKLWNDINYTDCKYWMDDFVNQKPPNGESYIELFNRTVDAFNKHKALHKNGFTWVTHSGVLRSILCYLTNTKLEDSFTNFKINYGAVIKIEFHQNSCNYQIL